MPCPGGDINESEMKFDKAILRVFEVRAKPGKAELLKRKLAETSVAVVDGKPGNLGYFFGADLSSAENDTGVHFGMERPGIGKVAIRRGLGGVVPAARIR